jgi:hypothetical protein
MAFGIAALAASSANAGIVTTWAVDVSAVFLPGSIVADPAGGSITVSNGDKTLRWGSSTGQGQSGLDILDSPANTVVDTGVGVVLPPVANVTVQHTNRPITGTSLDKVTLASTLTLTALDPAGNAGNPVTISFLIDFEETNNGASPCADGGANGSGVNINGCGDIFVLDKNSLNFPFFYDTGDGVNQQYFISFVEVTSGLNPLSPAACFAATGSSDPCLGFVTPENAVTPFQFGSLITTQRVSPDPIPVPGVLGLMGLGLVMLAGARRRKA